ncbi:MAG: hypothetical protein AB8G99_19175 [Planctomycetaceae bacterium]
MVERTGPQLLEAPYGLCEIPVSDPLAKILIAKWHAVPVLLNELDNADNAPQYIAHTLAMLYSSTGQVDPRWPDGKAIRATGFRILLGDPSGPSALGPFLEYGSYRKNRGDPAWYLRQGGVVGVDHNLLTSSTKVGFPRKADPVPLGKSQTQSLPTEASANRPYPGFFQDRDELGLHVDAAAQKPLIAKWKELRNFIIVNPEYQGGRGLGIGGSGADSPGSTSGGGFF